eukprot:TRINITY_DN9460_c0_g1_i2.p2 TRINITY_DN9460_c0_g1~~TRINITY_DN9460_c0_g1_i2.p2  ORF type:complete len:120 (+),score=21.63 TRINITY_DN9460_c0_g1_i2:247-606(+)
MRAKSREIFEKYFSETSNRELSIESSIKSEIYESLYGEPERSMFNAAQQSVMTTLENDTLAKFMSSSIYQTFITNPICRKVLLMRLERTESYNKLKDYVERTGASSMRSSRIIEMNHWA